jgi:hypothetical protein
MAANRLVSRSANLLALAAGQASRGMNPITGNLNLLDDDEGEVDDAEGSIDLSVDPDEIIDPLAVTVEVPLGEGEIDVLSAYMRDWKGEEPSNGLPHQVLRMLHELRQYREEMGNLASDAASDSALHGQVAILQSQLGIANEEIKRLTGAVRVAEELAKQAADDALQESNLGPQIEALDIHNVFAAHEHLAPPGDDD